MDSESPDPTIAEKAADPVVTPEDLAAEHKKDELVAAAEAQAVEVAPGDTKQDIAEKLTDAAGTADQPVEGLWVDVVAGEHKGLFGAYVQTLEHNPDGSPSVIQVRNRDHAGDTDLAVVNFSDARQSARTGGR